MRIGFCLADTVEVLHVHQLVIIEETWVGQLEFTLLDNVRQVAKVLVSPLVELTKGGAGTPLGIQLYGRHAQPNKPSEHRLLHVGVLLEGHVLDDWRELSGEWRGGACDMTIYGCVKGEACPNMTPPPTW